MLKNYGYKVVDLGKDVPLDKIIAAAKEEHAATCPTSFPVRWRSIFMPAGTAASWSFTARTRLAFPSGCKKSEAREFELEDR